MGVHYHVSCVACSLNTVVGWGGVGWGGGILLGRVECLSHRSRLQPVAPMASTPLPALTGITFSHDHDYESRRVLSTTNDAGTVTQGKGGAAASWTLFNKSPHCHLREQGGGHNSKHHDEQKNAQMER